MNSGIRTVGNVPWGSHFCGDKERIGQVVINLLTNAIKYSPDSNRV